MLRCTTSVREISNGCVRATQHVAGHRPAKPRIFARSLVNMLRCETRFVGFSASWARATQHVDEASGRVTLPAVRGGLRWIVLFGLAACGGGGDDATANPPP